ncbi:MAG TPA: endonuclease/exonuclease/phosphatase family protein [Caldilineaceae bacterium]|nr:endonuclease/exonuclease/phosphatase family protein [Caldilineaceae bacterium]
MALTSALLCWALLSLSPPAPLLAQATTGDADLTPIYAIQGDGVASPLAGRRVSARGLVTGLTLDGFFLQDPVGDSDPATSDGLFIYTWERPTVAVGQCVAVRGGLVEEYYGKTELNRVQAIEPAHACGADGLRAVAFPLPTLEEAPLAHYESLEGMLVQTPPFSGIVLGPYRWIARGQNELALLPAHLAPYIAGPRLFHDHPAAQTALLYLSGRVSLLLPDAAAGMAVRVEPPGLTAILDYSFDRYRLLPLTSQPLQTIGHLPRPPVVEPAGDADFTVCSLNLNGLGQGREQHIHPEEYRSALFLHARVIAQTLQGCTIVALQETGTPADAAALAEELASTFRLTYTATALPGPASADPDFPLTNSLLTRRERVEVVEARLSQGCSPLNYDVDDPGKCRPGEYPLFDRPPLIARLRISGAWAGDPVELWLINNHWKSKAGDETANAIRRLAQAQHVAAEVQALHLWWPGMPVIVLGDLNDFYGSAPVEALRGGVEPPLLHTFDYLPRLDRYTYLFSGVAQALDHLLVTPDLTPQIAEVRILHVHADFPEGGEAIPPTDHDPLLLRLRPHGGVTAGGALGIGGIQVDAIDASGAVAASAMTDPAGEYRLWDLPLAPLTLRFTSWPGVTLEPAEIAWTPTPGHQTAPAPQVRHQTAEAAALLAVITPDLMPSDFISSDFISSGFISSDPGSPDLAGWSPPAGRRGAR